MKTCPHCKIQVGGTGDYCPLCQNPLMGEGEPPHFPHVEPALRKASMLYKIIAFCLLAGNVVCLCIDFLMDKAPHHHWSILVLAPTIALLLLLTSLMKRRYNAPRLLFQLLVGGSLLALFFDWYEGWQGYSLNYIIPIFCAVTLVLNFIFAFINTKLMENGLVYLLLNIIVGVGPYIALMVCNGTATIAWSICLIVSVITFLGLVIFKWRDLWSEMQKRLHM